MKRVFLLATAALCLTARAALAQAQGYYATVEGGFNFVPDLKFRQSGVTDKEEFGTGGSVGGAFGYELGNGFRGDIDVLYSQAGIKNVNGAANGRVNGTSIMLDGLYDFATGSALTPYVGAGLGVIDVNARVAGATDSDWAPGYQLRAGLSYSINPALSVSTEYRWQQSENAKLVLAGMPTHQEFEYNGVLFGLTYHVQ